MYFNLFRTTVGVVACIRVSSYYWFVFYLIYNVIASGLILFNLVYGAGTLTFQTANTRVLFILMVIIYFSQSLALITDEICRVFNFFTVEGARAAFLIIAYLILSALIVRQALSHQKFVILLQENVAQ